MMILINYHFSLKVSSMDNLGKELLDFLNTQEIKRYRKNLYKLLETDENEVNVYYLVPILNLKSIIHNEGIKCREEVGKGIEDLSGEEVQAKRDILLEFPHRVLYGDVKPKKKKIHECIGFFWNPLNDTFRAFQRNTLLTAAEKDDDNYGNICILEMKLSEFFETDKMYWTTSKKNLASYPFSSFSKKIYREFKWDEIFSVPNDKENNHEEKNKFRSAEFNVFYGTNNKNSSPISPAFIKRILFPEQYEKRIKKLLSSIQDSIQKYQIKICSLKNLKIFLPKEELLNAEKLLINDMDELQRLQLPLLSIKGICKAINSFSEFKEKLRCSLTDKDFIYNKNMAYSQHGIRHITSVMFWVHILCYLTDTSWETEKSTQYAAFIHDLCREDNRKEEEEHGPSAVKEYEDFLRKKIPKNLLQSCKNAISYHCKDDSECSDKDLVWKLLKDADALDRGRFGSPNASKGCNIQVLRLDIFRNQELAKRCAWLACSLAHITRYTKWSENTFMDFKNDILRGLKAVRKNDILDPEYKEIADEMLRLLT